MAAFFYTLLVVASVFISGYSGLETGLQEDFLSERLRESEPRRCRWLRQIDSPENGRTMCGYDEKEGEEMFCTRVCKFPFKEESVTERCGSKTNFEWTHVMHHNSSAMPPCQKSTSCAPIPDSAVDNGHFECEDEDQTKTQSCSIKCDRGFRSESQKTVFCGPASAFRWSYEWPLEDEEPVVCNTVPVTAMMTTSVSCPTNNPRLPSLFKDQFKNALRPNPLMWRLSGIIEDCIETQDGPKLKISFDYKYVCVTGICKDACRALHDQIPDNLGQCQKMCDSAIMKTEDMLHQLRNVTFQKFAERLYVAQERLHSRFKNENVALEVEVRDPLTLESCDH